MTVLPSTKLNHFVQPYSVKAGKYRYWRYCYEQTPGDFNSIERVHIPGKTIELLEARVKQVRGSIAAGRSPEEICRLIHSWGKQSVGRQLANAR